MTITAPTGYAMEEIVLYDAPDDVVRPFVELTQLIEHERTPEDPEKPFDAVAGRMRLRTHLGEQKRWAAWTPERTLAGHAVLGRSLKDNLRIRDIWVAVRPEHRRRGLGRALYTRALEAIEGGDDLVAQFWTNSRVPPAEAFVRALGAQPKLRMRASQLDLAAIDRALIKEWSAIDPPGYRLEPIDGEVPDHLMDKVVSAYRVMNTMPKEDLDMEDWKVTPETIREWERLGRQRGQERWMVIAVEEATGASAGFTEIFFDKRVPSVLHQGGTAVDPQYRGRNLGKWVKARMVEWVLRDMPDARYIRTENAGSNAAMLAINVGMGFRLAWEEVIWQMPVAEARRLLRT